MRCSECGRNISENQSFCQYCGNPVKQIVISKEDVGQIKCKSCGMMLKFGTAFCTNCGTPVADATLNVSATEEEAESEGGIIGKLIAVVIMGLVLAFVVFAGYRLLDHSGLLKLSIKKLQVSEVIEDNEEAFEEIKTVETTADKPTEDKTVEEDTTGDKPTDEKELSDALDVEAAVLEIRDKYDEIVKGISFNTYDTTPIDSEVIAYSEQDGIKAIVTKKAYEEYGYTRTYYYDGGKLFFASYEGSDSHRFYFIEDKLIRWRYFPDSADTSKAINSDLETTPEYYRWEKNVLAESKKLLELWESAPADDRSAQEYILAGSDSRYIQKSELQGLTAEECRLARNEIYARHGRRFDDEYLQVHFGLKEWYTPMIDPDDFAESLLNSFEIANRDLIVEYEKECGYR